MPGLKRKSKTNINIYCDPELENTININFLNKNKKMRLETDDKENLEYEISKESQNISKVTLKKEANLRFRKPSIGYSTNKTSSKPANAEENAESYLKSITEITRELIDETIDTAGYVKNIHIKELYSSDDGTTKIRRKVILEDNEDNTIPVLFYGKDAVNFKYCNGDFMEIEDVKVIESSGSLCLSIEKDTTVNVYEIGDLYSQSSSDSD